MMPFLRTTITKPLSFKLAGHFIADQPSWTHIKRRQDSFEIIINLKGTLYIQQDEERYQVLPGHTLLLLADHLHQGYALSHEYVSFYWFHFYCPDFYEILDETQALTEMYAAKNNPYSFHYDLDERIMIPTLFKPYNIERLNVLFNQLLHLANSNYYTRHGTDYLLTLLMIELTQQTISGLQSSPEPSVAGRKFVMILEWLRNHIDKDVSISDVAAEFSLNKEYLSRFFKQNTGMCMQEYIHKLKISKAKELLYSGQSIKEIAYSLGFKDEKYFMRLFKKYENVTPTEFRKAYYRTYINTK